MYGNNGDPHNVSIENLYTLSREQSVSLEKRICEISALADIALSDAKDMLSEDVGPFEILLYIAEEFRFNDIEPHRGVMDENVPSISLYLKELSVFDKAVFAKFLTERINGIGYNIGEKDFLVTETVNNSIVYVKNRLADEAYDLFSDMLSGCTVSYADSFKEAAMLVASGKKEYCLLPLEEKGGARLQSIAGLIFSYDLKIASVVPVFGFDGAADMKYALVSSHFNVPEVAPDDDRYLEIRLSADSDVDLNSIINAANVLGYSVYRINTVKFSVDNTEKTYYTTVFKCEDKDYTALLVFFALFGNDSAIIGIYKNLE